MSTRNLEIIQCSIQIVRNEGRVQVRALLLQNKATMAYGITGGPSRGGQGWPCERCEDVVEYNEEEAVARDFAGGSQKDASTDPFPNHRH